MAGNPKYGLTYKTSDGKTKTLTGINLGTGSYTSEQITAFVGIVAEVTNKTVTALDVTAANAIPPPEPQKDLIESFTVSPSTLSATIGGDPVTAEIEITTSPQDANYQLRIEDAPAWVSIDDTTIIFAPPAGTTPDHYLFTVVAITKDDEAEFAVTLTVDPEPQKDLIESFTVSPSTLSATIGGDPVTAEIEITTSPQDANYQLRIEDAPAWVSIDDTTIIFAPPAGTTPDHYLFTVVAITKDDSAEFAVTLDVAPKVKKDPQVGYNFKQTYDAANMYATITATQEGNGELVITPGSSRFTKVNNIEITCSDPIANSVSNRRFAISASENEEYEAQQKNYVLNKNLNWKTYSITEK